MYNNDSKYASHLIIIILITVISIVQRFIFEEFVIIIIFLFIILFIINFLLYISFHKKKMIFHIHKIYMKVPSNEYINFYNCI